LDTAMASVSPRRSLFSILPGARPFARTEPQPKRGKWDFQCRICEQKPAERHCSDCGLKLCGDWICTRLAERISL
jgi:hypothetical protein